MFPVTSLSLAANVSGVKRKSSDSQLGPAPKRNKVQEGFLTSTPKSDNDRPASDSEMLEPIDFFTVDLFGGSQPSLPSRSMTLQAKSDPVRRVVRNKLPSNLTQSSNTRIERRSEQGRSSPQQPPHSATTAASPYVAFITRISTSKNAFVVSHLFRNHFPPQRRMQLRIKSLSHS